jgi:ubiquinone/menaquinone biosynthesis C-methylase UbiE
MSNYFHGYTEKEFNRLLEQSSFLGPDIYQNLHIPKNGTLLEIGCGVGAQTRILTRVSPDLKICCLDRNPDQIQLVQNWLNQNAQLSEQIQLVCAEFLEWNAEKQFDAAFICWVLEHVPDPASFIKHAALQLHSGASIHITEVQNSSLYLHPSNPAIENYWKAYCRRQEKLNGDPNVGAKIRNWLFDTGFEHIDIQAHLMLRDRTEPEELRLMMEYWWELMESVGDSMQDEGLISRSERDAAHEAIQHFHLHPDACFYYTFVQAEARKI